MRKLMKIRKRKGGMSSYLYTVHKLGLNIVNHRTDGFNSETVLLKYELIDGKLVQGERRYIVMWTDDLLITDWNLFMATKTILDSRNEDDLAELYFTYLEMRHPTYSYH